MTGPMKYGKYRIVGPPPEFLVKFFLVYKDDETGRLMVADIIHVDNMAKVVWDNKRILTIPLWGSLQLWQ